MPDEWYQEKVLHPDGCGALNRELSLAPRPRAPGALGHHSQGQTGVVGVS